MAISTDSPILIAGGGIGGLSLALALGLKGLPVELVEQADNFSEVGAGIQLGPNATRILSNWGLDKELQTCIYQPDQINIKSGRDNSLLNSIPLNPLAETLFRSPYYTIHRADLHNLLLNAVQKLKNVNLTTSFMLENITTISPENLEISSHSRDIKRGSVLIGADGIWSTVRNHIHPGLHPQYSGKTAWRALIPVEQLSANFKNQVALYLGPHTHLVHYPVKGGKLLNIVAVITDKDQPDKQWDKTGDAEQLLEEFQSWSPDIRGFLAKIDIWTKWALFTHKCPPKWTKGNITLLGDAVHPTLPFMAQGAVMAIEDAQCLANLLEKDRDTPQNQLIEYQLRRYRRAAKVQNTSKRQGTIYHLTGPFAFARNTVIANRSPKSLLKEYSWLYGYEN